MAGKPEGLPDVALAKSGSLKSGAEKVGSEGL